MNEVSIKAELIRQSKLGYGLYDTVFYENAVHKLFVEQYALKEEIDATSFDRINSIVEYDNLPVNNQKMLCDWIDTKLIKTMTFFNPWLLKI